MSFDEPHESPMSSQVLPHLLINFPHSAMHPRGLQRHILPPSIWSYRTTHTQLCTTTDYIDAPSHRLDGVASEEKAASHLRALLLPHPKIQSPKLEEAP